MSSFGDFRGCSQSLCAHRHPKKGTPHVFLFSETSPQEICPFPEICPFQKGHIKKDIFRPEKGHITLAQKFGSSDRCHLLGTLEVVLRAFAYTATRKSGPHMYSCSQKICPKKYVLFLKYVLFKKDTLKRTYFGPEKDILLCLKRLRALTGVTFWGF